MHISISPQEKKAPLTKPLSIWLNSCHLPWCGASLVRCLFYNATLPVPTRLETHWRLCNTHSQYGLGYVVGIDWSVINDIYVWIHRTYEGTTTHTCTCTHTHAHTHTHTNTNTNTHTHTHTHTDIHNIVKKKYQHFSSCVHPVVTICIKITSAAKWQKSRSLCVYKCVCVHVCMCVVCVWFCNLLATSAVWTGYLHT